MTETWPRPGTRWPGTPGLPGALPAVRVRYRRSWRMGRAGRGGAAVGPPPVAGRHQRHRIPEGFGDAGAGLPPAADRPPLLLDQPAPYAMSADIERVPRGELQAVRVCRATWSRALATSPSSGTPWLAGTTTRPASRSGDVGGA